MVQIGIKNAKDDQADLPGKVKCQQRIYPKNNYGTRYSMPKIVLLTIWISEEHKRALGCSKVKKGISTKITRYTGSLQSCLLCPCKKGSRVTTLISQPIYVIQETSSMDKRILLAAESNRSKLRGLARLIFDLQYFDQKRFTLSKVKFDNGFAVLYLLHEKFIDEVCILTANINSS